MSRLNYSHLFRVALKNLLKIIDCARPAPWQVPGPDMHHFKIQRTNSDLVRFQIELFSLLAEVLLWPLRQPQRMDLLLSC